GAGAGTHSFAFAFDDPGSSLPVKLLDFSAAQEKDHILLHWTTATEINNDYFTIEKSRDGITWTDIGIVSGAGNATTTKYYESIDPHPLDGLSFYRLKQTDYNGASEYFSAVSVFFKTHEIQIFFDPVNGQVQLENYPDEGLSGVILYNV